MDIIIISSKKIGSDFILIEQIKTPTFTITPITPLKLEWSEISKSIYIFFEEGGEIEVNEAKWDVGRYELSGDITKYNLLKLISNL